MYDEIVIVFIQAFSFSWDKLNVSGHQTFLKSENHKKIHTDSTQTSFSCYDSTVNKKKSNTLTLLFRQKNLMI